MFCWLHFCLFLACSVLGWTKAVTGPSPFSKIVQRGTSVTGFGARSRKKSIFYDKDTTSLVLFNITNLSDNTTSVNKLVEKRNTTKSHQATDRPKLWVLRTSDPDALFIQTRNKEGAPKRTYKLSISKETGDWLAEPATSDIKVASALWAPIEGTYGVYEVPSGIIWVFITKSDHVLTAPPLRNGDSPWWNIRRVSSLELVHLGRPGTLLSASDLKEEVRQLRLLRKSFKEHDFYFVSDDSTQVMDMTRNLQDALDTSVDYEDGPWWNENTKTPDARFFWNSALVSPLLERHKGSSSHPTTEKAIETLLQHVIPVTSAFVSIQSNLTIGGESSSLRYHQMLISRRSKLRAGTRFTKRGADATGAVANYAETEQICFVVHPETNVLQQVFSHIQIRGSIPLRWSSPTDIKTYRPRIRIGMDPLAQARALRLHLMEQQSYYVIQNDIARSPDIAHIVFVNLIDKHGDQGRLGRTFDAVLNALVDVFRNGTSTNTESTKIISDSAEEENSQFRPHSVHHEWFDFHAEVKNGKWDRLSVLLDRLSPSLIGHGYFHALAPGKKSSWKIQRKQNAVVRTNCMDCLDRTNVVQSILGRYVLFQQLSTAATYRSSKVGSDSKEKKTWASHSKSFRKNRLALPWSEGELAHRLLWADNADAISRLYAGTPALKGDFTRTGKRTKKGALDDGMNSIQRYYLNNFLDADRQEGIDLMVGFTNFTTVGESWYNQDDYDDGNLNLTSMDSDNMLDVKTIREAAQHSFFENILSNSGKESGLKECLGEIDVLAKTGSPQRRELDLRWLPGDLQTHLKSQALLMAGNSEDKDILPEQGSSDAFSCSAALLEIDRRAASDEPWWSGIADLLSDSEDDGGKVDESAPDGAADNDDQASESGKLVTTQPITATHLLGVLAFAIRAPMALAGTVVGLLGLVFLPEVINSTNK